jgi:hypothetical protein
MHWGSAQFIRIIYYRLNLQTLKSLELNRYQIEK